MAPVEAASGTQRIAFATSDARAFADLRGSLVIEAIRRRHAVVCIAPAFEAETRATLERLGVDCRPVVVAAQGYNPFAGYRLKGDLVDALRTLRPRTLAITDIALVPLFASAALRARVPHIVPMLEDFPVAGAGDKPVRKAFEMATGLVLATADAARTASRSGWLAPATRIDTAPTSGVDLAAVAALALPPVHDGLTFLLVAAATDRKAHEIFAAAGHAVRRQFPAARFPVTTTATAAAIAEAHVVVHAGMNDGLASGLLLGLASGRALITTDVAGSRDSVDERVNGCRVPPGDARALADAMTSFLRRPDQLAAMARASRSKAERRYDARAINAVTLAALGLAESFAAAA